jgi:hypothetical protein
MDNDLKALEAIARAAPVEPGPWLALAGARRAAGWPCEGATLEVWMTEMKAPRRRQRERAIRAVVSGGAWVVPAMTEALGARSWKLRESAALTLRDLAFAGHVTPLQGVPVANLRALLRGRRGTPWQVRRGAVEALTAIGPPALVATADDLLAF